MHCAAPDADAQQDTCCKAAAEAFDASFGAVSCTNSIQITPDMTISTLTIEDSGIGTTRNGLVQAAPAEELAVAMGGPAPQEAARAEPAAEVGIGTSKGGLDQLVAACMGGHRERHRGRRCLRR